ncbi:hypothetical protein [Candidatus Uabimicrobium sp. HlEnr_7]|uniref:hypothetical protein n=1 Tax=Candidatus Uabimicrobium helgolandensis TaxID=3095367 RepID=UPI0035574410
MSQLLLYSSDKGSGNALHRLLNNHNFNLTLLQKTEELVEKIRFGQADVVVLDLNSISCLYSELRIFFEMAEDIPVVILTPYDLCAQEIKNIPQNELCHFLSKPISTTQLEKLLTELISL